MPNLICNFAENALPLPAEGGAIEKVNTWNGHEIGGTGYSDFHVILRVK